MKAHCGCPVEDMREEYKFLKAWHKAQRQGITDPFDTTGEDGPEYARMIELQSKLRIADALAHARETKYESFPTDDYYNTYRESEL